MCMRAPSSFQDHFASLSDPRSFHTPNQRHDWIDILVIAVCAVICGAEGWEDIEEYGKAQAEWFTQGLDLPNEIPGHDTFRRVLSQLDPDELTQCVVSWTTALHDLSGGDIVAIDGKTLRRSFDRATSTSAIHMVSAWASANRLVFRQVKVDEKSNEITAIPKLLQMLDLTGAIVTIDAMGCQKEIGEKVEMERRYYLVSLPADGVRFGSAVRQHWGIENELHWVLDVSFDRGCVPDSQRPRGADLQCATPHRVESVEA